MFDPNSSLCTDNSKVQGDQIYMDLKYSTQIEKQLLIEKFKADEEVNSWCPSKLKCFINQELAVRI